VDLPYREILGCFKIDLKCKHDKNKRLKSKS